MHIKRSRAEFEWKAFKRKKTTTAFCLLHYPSTEMNYIIAKPQLLACRTLRPSHLFIYLVYTFLLATFAANTPSFQDKLSEVLSSNSPKSPRYLRSPYSFRNSREVKERWRRSPDTETTTQADPNINSLTTIDSKSPYYLYSPDGDYESGSFLDSIENMFTGSGINFLVQNTCTKMYLTWALLCNAHYLFKLIEPNTTKWPRTFHATAIFELNLLYLIH